MLYSIIWQMSKVSICQENTNILLLLAFREACANQANFILKEQARSKNLRGVLVGAWQQHGTESPHLLPKYLEEQQNDCKSPLTYTLSQT